MRKHKHKMAMQVANNGGVPQQVAPVSGPPVMKLTKSKEMLFKEEKGFPGVVQALFEHRVSQTNAVLRYTGPKIPPNVWDQVCSFFRWTYETAHSESQVRMYVNPKTNTWAAWAYPQEAGTGMTTRELDKIDGKDNPDFIAQRAQFKDDEGWLYFATVHHHCSGSAFQSGTDESNEKTIDGLHITMGKIDEPNHDLHARFYISGYCFEPDMSAFWEIPDLALESIPQSLHNQVARYDMCRASHADFPEQWKTNYIERKTVTTTYAVHNPSFYRGVGGSYVSGPQSSDSVYQRLSFMERVECGMRQIFRIGLAAGVTAMELQIAVESLHKDDAFRIILEAMSDYRLDTDDLYRYFPSTEKETNELKSRMDQPDPKKKEVSIPVVTSPQASTETNPKPAAGYSQHWE